MHINLCPNITAPCVKSSIWKETQVFAWLEGQRRIIWIRACEITEVYACTHTYLNQMPNHFQMLQCRIAFVKEEEKSLPFMSRYLGSGYMKRD